MKEGGEREEEEKRQKEVKRKEERKQLELALLEKKSVPRCSNKTSLTFRQSDSLKLPFWGFGKLCHKDTAQGTQSLPSACNTLIATLPKWAGPLS